MNNPTPCQNSVTFSKRKKLTSYICIVQCTLDFCTQRVDWGEGGRGEQSILDNSDSCGRTKESLFKFHDGHRRISWGLKLGSDFFGNEIVMQRKKGTYYWSGFSLNSLIIYTIHSAEPWQVRYC